MIIALICIIIFIIIYCYLIQLSKVKKYIYAILITSNDSIRNQFIPLAIKNFLMQNYPYKHLLIINHGKENIMKTNHPEITELIVDKTHLTLGDLRNMALEFIPINSYWLTYDDDDVRDCNYFRYLMKKIKHYDAIFLKNRFDYNLNNHFVYKCSFTRGMPLIFCKKIIGLKYLEKDTLEDIELQNDILKLGKIYKVIDNDPILYIRTLHRNNTSSYVDKNKIDIVKYNNVGPYKEYYVSEKERKKVISFYKSIKDESISIRQHYM